MPLGSRQHTETDTAAAPSRVVEVAAAPAGGPPQSPSEEAAEEAAEEVGWPDAGEGNAAAPSTAHEEDPWTLWSQQGGFDTRSRWTAAQWQWGGTHASPVIRRLTAQRAGLPRWWRTQLSRDPSPRVRLAIAETQDRFFAQAWSESLAPLVTDPDPDIRIAMASWAGLPRALAFQLLFADPDPTVRAAAVSQYQGWLGPGQVIALLLDPSEAVRARVLGRRDAMGASEEGSALQEVAAGEPNLKVLTEWNTIQFGGRGRIIGPTSGPLQQRAQARWRRLHALRQHILTARDLLCPLQEARAGAPDGRDATPHARRRHSARSRARAQAVARIAAPFRPAASPASSTPTSRSTPPVVSHTSSPFTTTLPSFRALKSHQSPALWALWALHPSSLDALDQEECTLTDLPMEVLQTWLADSVLAPRLLAREGIEEELVLLAEASTTHYAPLRPLAESTAASPALSPAAQSRLAAHPWSSVRLRLVHAHVGTLPAAGLRLLAQDPIAEIRGYAVGLRLRGWPTAVMREILATPGSPLNVSAKSLLDVLRHPHGSSLPVEVMADLPAEVDVDDRLLARWGTSWQRLGKTQQRRLLASPNAAVRLAMIRQLGDRAATEEAGKPAGTVRGSTSQRSVPQV